MARPRRTRSQVAYARRNARAKALGYESYYDYRAHDNGRLPPSAPRLRGASLARARGHRGYQDLLRAIKQGDVLIVEAGRRGRDGRYTAATATLLRTDGSEAEFRLQAKDIREPELQALLARIDDRGAIPSPIKSLSVRNLMQDVQSDELRGPSLEEA